MTSDRLFPISPAFTKYQISIDQADHLNEAGDDAQGDKNNDKEGQKSEKSSAKSGQDEIDHGLSPFRWRVGSMGCGRSGLKSKFFARVLTNLLTVWK
jgi:hypothetical protein